MIQNRQGLQMKDLPLDALTLISRARFPEKLIKDALADAPERATLGELLRDNVDLFEGYNGRVQWAARIRNRCAHVTDENFSIVEIKNAVEILDAAIAEMTEATTQFVRDVDAYEPPETPYVFSSKFYGFTLLTVLVIGLLLFLAQR